MYTSYFPKLLIEINKRGEKESAKIGLACAPAYAYARMGRNGKPPVYWCTWCTDPFNQACPTYHKDLRHIDGRLWVLPPGGARNVGHPHHSRPLHSPSILDFSPS